MTTSSPLSLAAWEKALLFEDHTRLEQRWAKALLLGGSLSTVFLAVQLAAPLTKDWIARAEINWLALLMTCSSWALLSALGQRVHRLATGIAALGLSYLLWTSSFFAQPSVDHLASVLTRELSTTLMAIPAGGLLCAWALLAASWLLGQTVIAALPASRRPWLGAFSLLLSITVAGVGTRAIIGYATGSPELLP